MMKATIYYVDHDKTDRDQRFDASEGQLLPAACFTKVAVVTLPGCFEPRADLKRDWRTMVCEIIFKHFNGHASGSLGNIELFNETPQGMRSMSAGDVIVLDGELGLFLCGRVGFELREGWIGES